MDATQIREHMKVVSSDGQHVGIVDGIDGDRIKLTKNDPAAGGQHRYIGLNDVDQVKDGKVCLNSQAKARPM
ncbi:MAG: DUF2171 domain-containing protein [Hyphomicrobiaceae bacterium]